MKEWVGFRGIYKAALVCWEHFPGRPESLLFYLSHCYQHDLCVSSSLCIKWGHSALSSIYWESTVRWQARSLYIYIYISLNVYSYPIVYLLLCLLCKWENKGSQRLSNLHKILKSANNGAASQIQNIWLNVRWYTLTPLYLSWYKDGLVNLWDFF